MWQSIHTFQEDPNWGLHVKTLGEEALDQQAGKPQAACVSTLELIRVQGANAETFLQGQATCDFREVAQGKVVLGAHCNPKGRIQASFWALKQGPDFLLLVPQGQGEPTRAALAKYAVFSQVSLNLDSNLLVLALLGPAAAHSADLWGIQPESGEFVEAGNSVISQLPNCTILALLPPTDAAATLTKLQQLAVPLAGDTPWWLSQLAAGIAQIPHQQSEQWIPQEINYDLVNGVSFKKGCYKGQEIVARIHYRGQTKVRARLMTVTGVGTITPGTTIADASGQNVGTILQSAYLSPNSLQAIAVVKNSVSESEPLRLEPNESSTIRLTPMPYAINN